jgi:hypothetical protein
MTGPKCGIAPNPVLYTRWHLGSVSVSAGTRPFGLIFDVPRFLLLVFCRVGFVDLVGELEFLQVLWRL